MPALRTLATLPLLPLALLTSLLLSLWANVTQPQLNDDAFTYLRAAELLGTEGLASVLDRYSWPGYSALIAALDPLLPGGLLASAQVLNAACYVLLTWSFIAIQRETGAGPRQQLLAAGIVLLFPLLNEMRHFIIRDAGFWAFSLLALLQLLRCARRCTWQRALAWTGCTLAAALFRLDALLPAMLAPLALLVLTQPQMQRTQALLLLYGSLASGAALLLFLAWMAGVDLPALMLFAWRYYLPLLLELGPPLQEDALALMNTLFTEQNYPGSDNLALGFVLLCIANVSSVLLNLAGALGVPFTLALLCCWPQHRTLLSQPLRALWLLHVASALLLLLVFQFIMHFQTQRYATLLALLLLLLLPAGLERWWQQAETRGNLRRWRIWLGVFCVYFAVDSLVSFGHSKQYLLDASHWLQSELPADATLTTNSFQLAWSSGRVKDYDLTQRDVALALEQRGTSDYLALELKQRDAAGRALVDTLPQVELVAAFSNARGDAVRIYRRNTSTP